MGGWLLGQINRLLDRAERSAGTWFAPVVAAVHLLNGTKNSMLAAVMMTYPFMAYWALSTGHPLVLAGVVIGLVLLRLSVPIDQAGLHGLWTFSTLGLVALLTVAVVSWALEAGWGMLLVPVVTNLTVGASFAATLWSKPPMIERFARMVEPQLSLEKIQWCFLWTCIWVGYFGISLLITVLLVLFAPVSWWVIYTGPVTYTLLGGLFAAEFIGRWYRFSRKVCSGEV